LIAPAVIVVAAVSFVPIGDAVYLSLRNGMYASSGSYIGLGNFSQILTSSAGLSEIGHTAVYVIVSLVVALPLSVGLALLLNRPIPGLSIFRTLILLPWVISQTVAGLLWQWLLNPQYSPLHLEAFGRSGLDPLSNPTLAMVSLIVVNVWLSYPLATILSLAALQTVPETLLEAAAMDGAGPVKRFARVTLPLMRPTLTVAAILLTLLYFNMVSLVLVLTNGGPLGGTMVLSLAAYQQSFVFFKLGLGAAYSILLFVFNIIFGSAYIRTMRSEMSK
jgi:ABC-type sugar transport system permease subunit